MIDQNFKYKTGLRRLGAAIIDTLVFLPLILLDEFIRTNYNSPIFILIWQLCLTLLSYCYSVIMHYKYGQTLGKMVARVKVVNSSELHNLTFKQSFLRDLVPIFIDLIGLLYFAMLLKKVITPTEEVLNNYDNFTLIVALVWILLELITMLANKKRRAIHDFIAGSVVIRTDYEKVQKT